MSLEQIAATLADLVGFRSVSTRSNLDCVDYIRSRLAALGATVRLLPNADGDKASILATIGPMVPGGVVLSGHTDVVPVENQKWSSDPWTLVRRDDRYYGRGATDMKGFIAVALDAAARAASGRLQRPLHLALSHDEEIGCLSAWALASATAALPTPAAVIVGEPTGMAVVGAHKGVATLITAVRGHSVHSSQMHRGVSATMTAARLIVWLENRMHELARVHRSEVFEPPITTIHVGIVEGGIAANVVAPSCRFLTDIRAIEGVDPRDIEADYRAYVDDEVTAALVRVHAEAGIVIERRSYTPALEPDPRSSAAELARRLTGATTSHAVAYASEAGIFQRAGLATVVCGPGSIDQAHQADEYIEAEQLRRAERALVALVDELAA
jgi:acetylornithine deacetylase